MKTRIKVILMTAVFLLFLPFPAAAAGENAAAADGTEYATLKEAAAAAMTGSGKVELLRSLTAQDLAAVTVSGTLEIDGKGFSVTFDKDFSGTLFKIPAGESLTLKNMNLLGAEANSGWSETHSPKTEDGYAYDKIVVSVPADAVALTGKIFDNAGSLLLEGCTISNIYNTKTNFYSGAGNLTLSKSKVSRNLATSYFFNISGGDLKMLNFVFEDNCGKNTGFFNIGNVRSFSVQDSSFSRNAMGTNGGVFNINNAQKMYWGKSVFTGNVCGNDGGVSQIKYSSKDESLDFTFTIKDCVFSENAGLAYGNQSLGGVLWIDASPSYNPVVDVRILDCTFTGNSACMGGALTLDNAGGKTLLEGCVFRENYAQSSGGAVGFRNDSGNVTMRDSEFKENSALGVGGALCGSYALTLELDSCEFTGNTTEKSGGAMYFKSNQKVVLKNGTVVTGNSAKNAGGGAYLYGSDGFATFVMDDSCTFANNSAQSAGDDIYAKRGTTLELPGAKDMDTQTPAGKDLTGWYQDFSNRRSADGLSKDYSNENWNISESNSGVYLKADWRGKRVDCGFNWDDAENKDGLRKDTVITALAKDAGGNIVDQKSLTLSAGEESGTISFGNLELTDAEGNPLTYSLSYDLPKGYSAELSGSGEEGFTLPLKHTPEVFSGDVTVRWMDGLNEKDLRPEKIRVYLYRDGEFLDDREADSTDAAEVTVSFGEYPKYDNGREILYTVSQDPIGNYVIEVNGTVIVNGLDLLKDAEMTADPEDRDAEEGGDGIPDYRQTKVIFSGSENGTLTGETLQIFTQEEKDGSFIGTVTPAAVTPVPAKGYLFDKWVKNGGTEAVDPFAAQPAEGGTTVIYTAVFAALPAAGDGGRLFLWMSVLIFGTAVLLCFAGLRSRAEKES